MSKHVATYGSIGHSGRRCGTTYIYSLRQAIASSGEPWFRFRNAECERQAYAEWRAPAPTSRKYFDVVDEAEDPQSGSSTRIEGEILNCPLAQYERDGIPHAWGRHLQRIGNTDYCRWYQKRSDYCWHPMGRLLKLNDAGLAALTTKEA